MANTPAYVELRCRSAFSFLDGASLPEDLADAAAELGYDGLALADRDGLYGAPRFFRAARKTGTLRPHGRRRRHAGAARPAWSPRRCCCWSRIARGYKNLCRLLTAMKAGRPKGEGAATYDLLAEHAGGLVALVGPDPRADLRRLREHLRPGAAVRRAAAPPGRRPGPPQPAGGGGGGGAGHPGRGHQRRALRRTPAAPGARRAHLRPPEDHGGCGRAAAAAQRRALPEAAGGDGGAVSRSPGRRARHPGHRRALRVHPGRPRATASPATRWGRARPSRASSKPSPGWARPSASAR